MRKLKFMTIPSLALVLVCWAFPPSACARVSFGLKLLGGFDYLRGGDFNDGLKGEIDLVKAIGSALGYTAGGDYRACHYAFDLGGDLIFYVTPAVGIGLGAGYIETLGRKTQVTLAHPLVNPLLLRQDPKVTAIPIRASLYFSLPLGPAANLTLHGGAAYYLARIHSLFQEEGTGYREQTENKADGKGFGFHGGIGLELNLSPNLALVLEGTGRYAKIGNFSGTRTDSDNTGYSSSLSGKLYYFRGTLGMLGTFPAVVISNTPPLGFGISGVREAKVDLSGFSARAGILVRF